MADTQVLGTCAARRVGSSPTSGITQWRLIYKQKLVVSETARSPDAP